MDEKRPVALPGIPGTCGYCGKMPDEWPLTLSRGRIYATCPLCWTVAAPVRAVAAAERDAYPTQAYDDETYLLNHPENSI